jgi:hypothetical protein
MLGNSHSIPFSHTLILKSEFGFVGCIVINTKIPFVHNIIASVSSWNIIIVITRIHSVSEVALRSCLQVGSEFARLITCLA